MAKKVKLINESTRMTDKQARKLEKDLNKSLKQDAAPKIIKSLNMRAGEEDIRQLPDRDIEQLNYRVLCDMWQFNNAMLMTLNDILLVNIQIAKKLGIEIETELDKN